MVDIIYQSSSNFNLIFMSKEISKKDCGMETNIIVI